MELAYRTRIKLFFRPFGLVRSTTQAGEILIWEITENNIVFRLKGVKNSPCYVSMNSLSLRREERKYSLTVI